MNARTRNGCIAAAASFLLAVAFFAYVAWFESPATWTFEGRIVSGFMTIFATFGGYMIGSHR